MTGPLSIRTLLFTVLITLPVTSTKAQYPAECDIHYLAIKDGTGAKDSLVFGLNDRATFGVDAQLGENSSPPLPPGFSAIFVCPRIPAPPDWGIGLLKFDLRDTVNDLIRIDSFYIQIRNDSENAVGADVHLRWPNAGWIYYWCDSMKLVIPNDSIDLPAAGLNMATQDSLDVSTPYAPNGWNPIAPNLIVRIFKYHHKYRFCPDAVSEKPNKVPHSFSLDQNFPNPFNPSTEIHYTLPSAAHVLIRVYNLLGQVVATVVDENLNAGYHSSHWDATAFHSGVYFCRMQANGEKHGGSVFTAVRKMMLLR